MWPVSENDVLRHGTLDGVFDVVHQQGIARSGERQESSV